MDLVDPAHKRYLIKLGATERDVKKFTYYEAQLREHKGLTLEFVDYGDLVLLEYSKEGTPVLRSGLVRYMKAVLGILRRKLAEAD